jgi:L-alanine-DL-glutamate epimerase-like enolase superfamily enzyme
MEIRHVETVPLVRDSDERFANAQKWIDSREYCLVRIETGDGAVGWGECWGPVAGNREVVEERAAPLLRGRTHLGAPGRGDRPLGRADDLPARLRERGRARGEPATACDAPGLAPPGVRPHAQPDPRGPRKRPDPIEGGEVPVPDGPGLGIEVDRDTLDAFRVD